MSAEALPQRARVQPFTDLEQKHNELCETVNAEPLPQRVRVQFFTDLEQNHKKLCEKVNAQDESDILKKYRHGRKI